MDGDAVQWQGTPAPFPTLLAWAAILAIALGLFAAGYWIAMKMGVCVDFLVEENCVRRRRGIEILFVALGFVAAVAALIILKIAMGFSYERYAVSRNEITVTTNWPLAGSRSQPLAYVSVVQYGNSLRFFGAGEKPVLFGPLRKGEADRLCRLIHQLKGADPLDQKNHTGAEDAGPEDIIGENTVYPDKRDPQEDSCS